MCTLASIDAGLNLVGGSKVLDAFLMLYCLRDAQLMKALVHKNGCILILEVHKVFLFNCCLWATQSLVNLDISLLERITLGL